MPPLAENLTYLNAPKLTQGKYNKITLDSQNLRGSPLFRLQNADELDETRDQEQLQPYGQQFCPIAVPPIIKNSDAESTSGNEADDEQTASVGSNDDPRKCEDAPVRVTQQRVANLGQKTFISPNIKPFPSSTTNLPPIKRSEHESAAYNALVDRYNTLLDDHKSVANEVFNMSTKINDFQRCNDQRSSNLEDVYSFVLSAQAEQFQSKLRSLQSQLASSREEVDKSKESNETLIQWVKSMFSELERAAKQGNTEFNLRISGHQIAKLLKKPNENIGNLQILYRAFVKQLNSP